MLARLLPLFVAVPLAAQSFDGNRLETGKFDYTITDQGKEVAKLALDIRKTAANQFTFSADATATACQHWESVATAALKPISARLSFCKDGNNRPMFELVYTGNRVSGTKYSGKPPAIQKQDVEAVIPASTVDQRIDWAAVMAMDLKPGLQFGFNVYDPGTGVSRLTGRVAGAEEVELPAGRFHGYHLIYQMDKQGRVEHYESLVSRNVPRILLKIRFPNGTWSELVSMK